LLQHASIALLNCDFFGYNVLKKKRGILAFKALQALSQLAIGHSANIIKGDTTPAQEDVAAVNIFGGN
jgi:hypothetical protein